ncbi:ABC transporter ATP-binding protein [Thalassotalea euphylliae]|uniref:ABC transporter ATP-binding protein n=1 Tax=Thalassotalea euphylliae TaxID=1655234 RepID=A0A3E0TVX5_9GAMM|nr:ABC transporter ATP-binding protein [Thalassotalea euphylliae]REL28604.1 ABC transporter ATP-binding protein [Thalassotalea euphylliae]
MDKPLIKVSQLCKSFYHGDTVLPAINNVSFEVYKGDYVAILGRSGSGKSTLLSVLGLLDTPSSGTYELSGHDITQLSFYQQSILRNKHLGWVFQNFNLINDMNVVENITLPLKYNPDIKPAQYRALALASLKKVNLTDKAEQYPSQLSGGQQQRVAIARAIVSNPDLILADEPTGNLDTESGQLIIELLNDINNSGTTVLMVTHDQDIAAACKQSITIENGRIATSHNLRVVA